MSILDECKKQWVEKKNDFTTQEPYDEATLSTIIKSRMKKQNKIVMQYFWASFALQILVYALLCHVIVKYWSDTPIVFTSIAGILIFIPFTTVMMKKFKRLAIAKIQETSLQSIFDYVNYRRALLSSFFTFKKRYEWILIPLSSAIGVWITFEIFVPGGVQVFTTGALITYALTLVSCYWAIRSENKKSFIQPLDQLREILDEYK